MVNCVVIQGRLTAEPSLKTTVTGKELCDFTVAVDRFGQNSADFINVTAWNSTAKFVCDHFSKGQMIAVRGRIQVTPGKDKNGNNRNYCCVVADEVHFCGDKVNKASDEGESEAFEEIEEIE